MELIAEAKQNDAAPAMFVTWRYTDECPEDPSWNASASAEAAAIRLLWPVTARLSRHHAEGTLVRHAGRLTLADC